MLIISILAFASCKSGSVSTSAFYDIPMKFLRKDVNGKTYFEAYAKGRSEKECRENAKRDVIKVLLFEGVRQGYSLPPILTTPSMEKKFRNQEESILRNLVDNNDLVTAKVVNDNKLLQSNAPRSQGSMPFEVGVDHGLLSREVLKSIN